MADDDFQTRLMRQRLAAALGSPAQDQSSSGAAFAASGGDIFPVADQPSIRPVPQPDSYRATPFAAPGMPPVQNLPHNPNVPINKDGARRFIEEMTKLEGVVDTSKLNDTPLWNGGGMTLDEVRKSHPPIAPLLEKWQREAVEYGTRLRQREHGMSEADARREALEEVGPGTKIDGLALDPDGDSLPPEWGGEGDTDQPWMRSYRTRNDDFMGMGEFLRRVLEVPWPQGQPIPPDIQQELDDLLQDHQYDQRGKRVGPISMQDGGQDLLLSSIYRRNMSPAA